MKSWVTIGLFVVAAFLAFLAYLLRHRRLALKPLQEHFDDLHSSYTTQFGHTWSGSSFLAKLRRGPPKPESNLENAANLGEIGFNAITNPSGALLTLILAPVISGIGDACRSLRDGDKTDAQLKMEAGLISALVEIKRRSADYSIVIFIAATVSVGFIFLGYITSSNMGARRRAQPTGEVTFEAGQASLPVSNPPATATPQFIPDLPPLASGVVRLKATPTPFREQSSKSDLSPIGQRSATDGIFYMLQYASVKTSHGVWGFEPGCKVHLVKVIKERQIFVVSDGKYQIEVLPSSLTRDPKVAAKLQGEDRSAQSQIGVFQERQQRAFNTRQAQLEVERAEHVQSAEKERIQSFVPSDPDSGF